MMITITSRRRPMIAAVALLFFVFDASVPVFFTANAFVTRPATVARYHQNQQEHTHSRPCELPLFMAEEEKSDVSLYGEKNGLALLSTFSFFGSFFLDFCGFENLIFLFLPSTSCRAGWHRNRP